MNLLLAYCLIWLQIDPTQPGPVPGPILGDTWTLFLMVVKMCVTLAAVCLLAYITLRHGLPKLTGIQTTPEQMLKVVARFPLENQKTLYIVEVTGKHLLLGVTQERIELISELESSSVVAALESATVAAAAKPTLSSMAVKEFSKYLRR